MPYSELLKLLLGLGLTLGLFVGFALLLKKLQAGTGTGPGLIRVLAAQPLGGKDKLWLVAVGEQQLLLGSSPGQVSCLHVLATPLTAPANQAAPLFAAVLQHFSRGEAQ